MATPGSFDSFRQSWAALDRVSKLALTLLAFVGLPAIVLMMFDITGTAAKAWLEAVALYFIARAVVWAVRQDRKEREMRSVEQSLWADLKDIEDSIVEKVTPKRRKGLPQVRDALTGEPMMCIMGCGRYATLASGGRFCREHS